MIFCCKNNDAVITPDNREPPIVARREASDQAKGRSVDVSLETGKTVKGRSVDVSLETGKTDPSLETSKTGYATDFIGIDVPLPTFDESLEPHVLRKESFDQGSWRKFINYSVSTNMTRRQPVCVALNINQQLLQSTKRGPWKIDMEVGPEYQLDNAYYRNNEWDRGHMANRSNAAWGATDAEAKLAANDTMYYTNSCLQHENLNQDEWLEVENWVKGLTEDKNDKISVFSGPIYGLPEVPKRYLTPKGRQPAEIPSGFFKVVVFMDKNGDLATRSFIYLQDAMALQDKRGKKLKNHTSYQVSTAEIEEKTGLLFDRMLHSSNPMEKGQVTQVSRAAHIIAEPIEDYDESA